MPTKSEIYRHWQQWLIDNECDCDRIYCWACGRELYVTRFTRTDTTPQESIDAAWNRAAALQICHIVPRSLGGQNTVDNLFLLCPHCHDLAPDTVFPDSFLKWALNQSHLTNSWNEFKTAAIGCGVTKERFGELAALFEDEQFETWASDKSSVHRYQDGSGSHTCISTGLVLAIEYLRHLDHTKPGGSQATQAHRHVPPDRETSLDMGDPPTRDLLVTVMAWVAQHTRESTINRTKAGIERAREQGKRIGRPPCKPSARRARESLERGVSHEKITELEAPRPLPFPATGGITMEAIAEMTSRGIKKGRIADDLGISRTTLWRMIREWRSGTTG